MPIHDWTRVPAGLFHHFLYSGLVDRDRAGVEPRSSASGGPSYFVVEQRSGPLESDVLTIESAGIARLAPDRTGATATAEPPVTRLVRRTTKEPYARRANRIVVRHHLGRILAVIEIVSPGNKDSRAALRDFVDKTVGFLRAGVHVLIVDLFPPTTRDPFGIRKAIWDEIEEEEFTFPPGKDRILASYQSGVERVAYIEPVGVGDELPQYGPFLAGDLHARL